MASREGDDLRAAREKKSSLLIGSGGMTRSDCKTTNEVYNYEKPYDWPPERRVPQICAQICIAGMCRPFFGCFWRVIGFFDGLRHDSESHAGGRQPFGHWISRKSKVGDDFGENVCAGA